MVTGPRLTLATLSRHISTRSPFIPFKSFANFKSAWALDFAVLSLHAQEVSLNTFWAATSASSLSVLPMCIWVRSSLSTRACPLALLCYSCFTFHILQLLHPEEVVLEDWLPLLGSLFLQVSLTWEFAKSHSRCSQDCPWPSPFQPVLHSLCVMGPLYNQLNHHLLQQNVLSTLQKPPGLVVHDPVTDSSIWNSLWMPGPVKKKHSKQD